MASIGVRGIIAAGGEPLETVLAAAGAAGGARISSRWLTSSRSCWRVPGSQEFSAGRRPPWRRCSAEHVPRRIMNGRADARNPLPAGPTAAQRTHARTGFRASGDPADRGRGTCAWGWEPAMQPGENR